MREYEIWAQGYSCTGSESGAIQLDTISASSFEDAVWAWLERDPTRALYFRQDDDGTMRYWGCELYDNEHDARTAFG
jgi:nicotinic acid phosphoribosyltransferase